MVRNVLNSAIFMVALGFGASPLAQDCVAPECNLCHCAVDGSCSEIANCSGDNRTGCAETQFTVSCSSTHTYRFEVLLSCEDCDHCLACAYLMDEAGNLVNVLQAGCGAGCSSERYESLAGGDYTLYACLRACGGSSCSRCSGCYAKARVYCVSGNCGAACSW